MARAGLAFLFILFLPSLISFDSFNEAVVWNVGQGQWITFSLNDVCLHFDMGGEMNPLQNVWRLCHTKENHAFFSHWDQDHLNFLKTAAQKLGVCLEQAPKGLSPSDHKQELVAALLPCESKSKEVEIFAKQKLMTVSNDGYIYVVHRTWLLTADSPQKAERQWIKKSLPFINIKYFVIGHHGSKSSSSHQLLAKLKNVEVAVASQRLKRYGHPHREVIQKLRDMGLQPLLTESFGHLHFRL